jgi:hypothetical protein
VAYCRDNQRFKSSIVLGQFPDVLEQAGILVATAHDCIYVRDAVRGPQGRDLARLATSWRPSLTL